jgi:signal peptidase
MYQTDHRENIFSCAHSGTSMNPTLSSVDLLEIEPYRHKKPRTGDVILFVPPNENYYVVHRIIRATSNGYRTRGDNCSCFDEWVLKTEHILGQVIGAQKDSCHRKVIGGFQGKLFSIYCRVQKYVLILLTKNLGPVYRSLCTDGFLNRLIPFRLQPQVASFKTGSNDSHKLLLGKRVIGSYNESLLKWQIKRPYRLFVNESSLPIPR